MIALRLLPLFLLLIVLASIACYLVVRIFTGGDEKNRRREIKNTLKKIKEADRDRWAAFPRVQSLLDTYIEIVTKLGPDSNAAKKFRFNTDNDPLLSTEQNAALTIFQRMADRIDETYVKLHETRLD